MSIYPDHVAGCLGAVASLAAIVGRARGVNAGVHVEVAQVETVTGMLGDLIAAEGVEPGSVVPMGNRSEVGAPWGLYRCAGEEEWVAITCRDDADWRGLVAAMGSPTWATDCRVRGRGGSAWTSRRDRRPHRRVDRGAVEGRGGARVPGAACARGADADRCGDDDRRAVRGTRVRGADRPAGGRTAGARRRRVPRRRAWRVPTSGSAPDLGEHTRQIARDQLGLDDDEIDRLLAAGVLETTPPVG